MTSADPFVAVLITMLVVGAIVQLLVLAYRYRKGEFGAQGRTIDGDVVYRDDRLNEMLHAAPGDEDADPDVDPAESDAVRCPDCRTPNEGSYTFCRNCTSKLPGV